MQLAARRHSLVLLIMGIGAACADACVCGVAGHADGAAILPADPVGMSQPFDAGAGFGLGVPIYHSNPSASVKVYLDFDGDHTPTWGIYFPGTTPAYSIDDDLDNFSAEELTRMHEIWMRISEAYSPFNIDVTTENPGALNDQQALRIVIGGEGKDSTGGYWVGQKAGGIGYIGGFYDHRPNTVFVFSTNLLNGDPRRVADAAAHEAGHAFGLEHQSRYTPQGIKTHEYNPGDPLRAPFMGRSYDAVRGVWWKGDSTVSPFFEQDDLAQLNSDDNGFYFRADDHGDTIFDATPLNITSGSASASGIIEYMTDADMFSFTLDSESHASFTVTGAPFGAMLDPSLALYDGQGVLLEFVETPSLTESLSIALPAGDFHLAVLSAGQYGDIGQFFLTATFIPEPASLSAAVLALWLLRRRVR